MTPTREENDEEQNTLAPLAPSKLTRKQSRDVYHETRNKRLSVASAAVDRGDKGYLDDLEKTIRTYDKNGDGNYDVEEVFEIVKDLEDQRHKRYCLKKTLMAFVAVALVLLLCV